MPERGLTAMTKLLVLILLACIGCLGCPAAAFAQNPHLVVYEGTKGPGSGKHIVFLAGDHEYRSEESLPALARILARHYGFKTSVFFTTDPKTGFIDPDSSNISGLEALRTADLLVVFLRFKDFPDDQMQHIVDYLDRGGPIVGFRTATHAFQIQRPDAKFLKYTWKGVEGYTGGFGRQILGETWVTHYGKNHVQSSKLVLQADQARHPILRGVKDVWVQSGGYTANPIEGSTTLAMGQILDGMTPDSPPAKDKQLMPVAWYRTYTMPSGKSGRVFTTTHGASEDLLNDGFRRMSVNAILWAAGLEAKIQPASDISFVGPYQPTTYSFGGYVKGVKPADLKGWESPILPKAQK
jgi:type 1 glutamine amidotransferase